MRNSSIRKTALAGLAAGLLLGIGSAVAAQAAAPWHDAMVTEAQNAINAGEDARFFLAYVNEDEIPELIINHGSVAAGETIYFWEEDHLYSYLYEYYAMNYIPFESVMDIAGGRMGGYYDSICRYTPGAVTEAAYGQYMMQDPYAAPVRNDDGTFVMDDQFTYTWQNIPVSAQQYVAARDSVYDRSRSVTPYDADYDLYTLDAVLTQAENEMNAVVPEEQTQEDTINPFVETVPAQPSAPGTGSIGSLAGYDTICAAAANNIAGNLQFVSSDVSDYPNVNLYFSFSDGAGSPIELYSMTAGIRETIAGGEEIERTVRYIEKLEGNQGLSIDIVADKSSSMSGDLGRMQDIMYRFVASLDYASGDKAEIISFDSYIMYMCTYTQDVTLLQNGIYNMTAYGNTALYDALVTGINNAGSQAGARCVIGFTDGQDNESSYTPNEVIQLAWQKEVPVYLIGTADADAWQLAQICDQTGGRYWSVNDISDISVIMQEIYRNQKDMYCVCYESDAGADPYSLRNVRAVIADDTYIGRADYVSFQATPAIVQTQHASRYEIVQADVSWQQANDACIARGGHLATITSPEEMQQLSAMAENAGVKYCWIGGYTSVRNGSAFGHWITGEPFDYTAWYPGEPSRNDTDGTPEFYLMLWNVEGVWSWNDQRNDVIATGLPYFVGKVGYICEFET